MYCAQHNTSSAIPMLLILMYFCIGQHNLSSDEQIAIKKK